MTTLITRDQTWAEAIAWADRMAREGEDDGDLVMENHYPKTLATTILEYKILIATLADKLRQMEHQEDLFGGAA